MPSIEMKLRPFAVPNFVLVETAAQPRQQGVQEAPSFPLAELNAETLDELCQEFRAAVFAKAKKRDPFERIGVGP